MREWIAKGVATIGAIAAVAAAGLWAYFIWTSDWGRFGTRDWGLWLMGFTTGTIVVFLAVGFVGFWLATLVDPDAF